MRVWKNFQNLNTISKVCFLSILLLIVVITTIILVNYKKVEDLPSQNDIIPSSSFLNVEEDKEETVNQEITNIEIENDEGIETEEKIDIKENEINVSNKKEGYTNNKVSSTIQPQTNTSTQNNNEQENNKAETNTQTSNTQMNTQIKNEEPTENTALANTHFTKYNAEKTNHAVAYLNSKIKQAEYYEELGGKAVAVTEKPCKSWFSYSYDEKLNPLVISGCILQVYVEDEYAYDSKGTNYYLYDTKAYIYTY